MSNILKDKRKSNASLLTFLRNTTTKVVEIGKLRERETQTQQVSDEGTYLREPVFFPFSSDVHRGQKEQTKNNDCIHNGA